MSIGLGTYTTLFRVCYISALVSLGLTRVLHFLGGDTYKLPLFHNLVFQCHFLDLVPYHARTNKQIMMTAYSAR